MKYGIIYIATSKTTKKSYIGQTIQKFNRRISEHKRDYRNPKCNMHHGKFHRALRKYGFNNFKWEILHNNIPQPKLNKMEIKSILQYNSYKNGYNSTTGGEMGMYEITSETRKKLSDANRGKKLSEQTKKRISNTLKKTARRGKEHPYYNVGPKYATKMAALSNRGKKKPNMKQNQKDLISKTMKKNKISYGEDNPKAKLNWEKSKANKEEI